MWLGGPTTRRHPKAGVFPTVSALPQLVPVQKWHPCHFFPTVSIRKPPKNLRFLPRTATPVAPCPRLVRSQNAVHFGQALTSVVSHRYLAVLSQSAVGRQGVVSLLCKPPISLRKMPSRVFDSRDPCAAQPVQFKILRILDTH